MKTFVFSLCFFALLLAFIITNCVYILHTASTVGQMLEELATATEPAEQAEEILSYWNARQKVLSLSVPYNELYDLRDRLCELYVAAEKGDSGAVELARLQALNLLEEICLPARFSIYSVL